MIRQPCARGEFAQSEDRIRHSSADFLKAAIMKPGGQARVQRPCYCRQYHH